MPLETGKSREAFSHNVEKEMAAGKPQKQALAIAYRTAREDGDMMAGILDECAAKLNDIGKRLDALERK